MRRRVFEYPESKFNTFCSKLDKKYQASFSDYNLMVNDLYLTVILRPSSDQLLSFFAAHEREDYARKELRQSSSIKLLEDINRMIEAQLKKYNSELLGTYDKEGHIYSSALEFLAFLINSVDSPMPVCRDRFASYITLSRPFFSKSGEIGEIRMVDQIRYFGILEITDYDETTEPGQLNSLLESDYEFVLTQSSSALSQYAAKGFLQKHKQQLIDARDVAYLQRYKKLMRL